MCHWVEGQGGTGYVLLRVDDEGFKVHSTHPGDLVPAPNLTCSVSSEATARVALAGLGGWLVA